MFTLAETVRDGIRYTLRYDDWDTAALLRDYADSLPGVLAVQSWDRWGWWTIWARKGVAVIGYRYDDDEDRRTNLARGIHLHYESGYSQGDAIRIAHDGSLSRETAGLIHSLIFDGLAYAIAEEWTNSGFKVIDSISGLSLMDGPEETLEYAIREYLEQGE